MQVKRICRAVNDTSPLTIQIVGMPALEGIASITLDQVAALGDRRKQVNCGPLPQNLVYMQFGRDRNEAYNRQRMEALRVRLQRAGFYAPGVEAVDQRAIRSEVRYFAPEDRVLADSAAAITRRELGISRLPSVFVPNRGNARPHQIEVWLDSPSLGIKLMG